MIARHEVPLAAEDAARLHMSMAENPMLITALLLLDRPIGFDELASRLARRLARHPRFRQVVIEPRLGLGMPHWRDDPTFDVAHHVHHIDVALLPGAPSLDEVVGDLSTIPLARQRPLWRVHLIDGRQPAVMVVVHHALADGATLLALLHELVDEEATTLHDERERPATLSGRAWKVAAGTLAAVRFAARRADPPSPLKGRMTERKHLAFSPPLPLERLRSIAQGVQMSVTGLLLAAVTGACRAELARNGSPDGLVLHALVPMRLEARPGIGNQYGSALVPLPVGTADLAARIRQVRGTARALRSRRAGLAGARLAAAGGALSAAVERLGVSFFSRRASVAVSSVRGPTSPFHLCGAAVRDVLVWAPASGTIALSITLMSYAGNARIGVAADGHVVGSARRVVAELQSEIATIATFASGARA